MSNYRFDDRSRGSRNFGRRDRRRQEMFDAVCDECGKDCKVPFRPSGDKPIYCSDCFEKRGGRDRGRPSRRGTSKRSFRDEGSSGSLKGVNAKSIEKLTQSIEALNKKLNNIIELLSAKKGKPVVKESKPKTIKVKKEKKVKKKK